MKTKLLALNILVGFAILILKACLKIYFNGKKQFTRFEPVKPLCNSTPLLDDIKMIIEELNQ